MVTPPSPSKHLDSTHSNPEGKSVDPSPRRTFFPGLVVNGMKLGIFEIVYFLISNISNLQLSQRDGRSGVSDSNSTKREIEFWA